MLRCAFQCVVVGMDLRTRRAGPRIKKERSKGRPLHVRMRNTPGTARSLPGFARVRSLVL